MKKIIIILTVLLLSGCSTTFAYNNASWLVYWYLDDYLELNDAQEDQFDGYLESWLQWHRTQELPKYEAQLTELIDDVSAGNMSVERVAYHREKAKGHWIRAREFVALDIVELAKTLDDQQVSDLFEALEEENVEDEEDLQENKEKSLSKREKDWVKRNQKGMRRWLGKLSDEQKEFIMSFNDRFESTREHWLMYKRSYQQALQDAFKMESRGEDFATLMYELIINPEQYRSPEFIAASDLNNQASAQYLIGLYQLSSDKQRENLVEEIDEFRQDVKSLQR